MVLNDKIVIRIDGKEKEDYERLASSQGFSELSAFIRKVLCEYPALFSEKVKVDAESKLLREEVAELRRLLYDKRHPRVRQRT